METAAGKPLRMKYWLTVQQAVAHLGALAEEPIGSENLAKLVEDYQLQLYWHRPGQRLTGPKLATLDQPLRLWEKNPSVWRAIVGILRHHPALPAAPDDTPLLEDGDGRLRHITFDFNRRPEPYSSAWYPSYGELMVKRSDLEGLRPRLFAARDEAEALKLTESPQLLLDIIAQLERLAMAAGSDGRASEPDPHWLAQQIAASDRHFDPAVLERLLTAAGRRRSERRQ